MDKMQSKPFKQGCFFIEFMDGTAEEYRIRPDSSDPNEIIKFDANKIHRIGAEVTGMIKQPRKGTMKKRLFAFLNNTVNKKFAESDIMHRMLNRCRLC